MQNTQPGNNSWLGIASLLAKLLRSEIVSSKQRNSVLTHRAKLYSPLLPAGSLAGDSQFSLRSKFSSPKANITEKGSDCITIRAFFWQRMRDSNPRKRSQSPVCYRYTNPLCVKHGYYYNESRRKVKHFFPILRIIFISGQG